MIINNNSATPPSSSEPSPQEAGEPPDWDISPLPTNRSLVVEYEHAQRPGRYYLLLKDNDEVSDLYKSRVIKHFLSSSVGEFSKWERELKQNGQIFVGPHLFEVAESKAQQISEDGKGPNGEIRYVFEMAFVKI